MLYFVHPTPWFFSSLLHEFHPHSQVNHPEHGPIEAPWYFQDLTPNFELLHLEHGGTTDQVPGSEEKNGDCGDSSMGRSKI